MIIRNLGSSVQLITQPQHAKMAAFIIANWHSDHFPPSPRKESILHAIDKHDEGWMEIDETLIVDEETGELVDFIKVPDEIKRHTSQQGIELLSSDPYAGALVAQHRLNVYRRYASQADWKSFFTNVKKTRDTYLRAAGSGSLNELLHDYNFLRAGDLASLTFCTNGPKADSDGCGYSMRLEGMSLIIIPDPYNGKSIDIEVEMREIEHQKFDSAESARQVIASAPVVKLKGKVRGATS